MVKVGQIGKGKFGEKILNKLNSLENVSIEWVCGSQDKWWSQSSVDWVIIASPNEFHYEQVKYFLKNSINVFCEKPCTLCLNSLNELIELSKQNSVKLYIDDVYLYGDPVIENKFIYKKWGGSSGNIIDRIAYHHFYLLYNKDLFNTPFEIQVTKNKANQKSFDLVFSNGNSYSFEYDFEWYKQKIHNISFQYQGDALEKMLKYVFDPDSDFSDNHKRSIFATKISEYVKQTLYAKIAVVGAGIYGITAAIKLRANGFKVDLFEKNSDIMQAASGINQYRVHRGYHYPRSLDTINSCKNNESTFIKYYNQSISKQDITHYYAIAKEDSLTSPEQYLKVLDKTQLEWEITNNLPNCDLTVKVNEKLYDPALIKKISYKRIKGNGINLFLNKKATLKDLTSYKHRIYSTYSTLNQFNSKPQSYQFELCEKPVFKLPIEYKNKSIVIMDGPFMCFDPLLNTDYHLGGNVVHAIHIRNIGDKPEIPRVYKKYLNRGIIKNPKYTNVSRFIESAKKYFPNIEKAKHIGSMYTVRTVLPNKDNTDERPTIVKQQDNDFILFSGKVGNCVEAADTIINFIKNT